MSISADQVKKLRERTGAGMMDCKKALTEMKGDMDKAVDHLRKIGAATAAKKGGRATNDGLVYSYIHPGGRVGVLLEVNCETDFVARTGEFQTLCKDIAMHVAASSPVAVRREEVAEEVVASERAIYEAQAEASGKPEKVREKMVEGRLEKFFGESVLLEQPFIKEPKQKVSDVVAAVIGKLGENITVRRFARFSLGE
ncbi:MAG: translation elongation factor Ts [Candidatus Eisenbacteria bacterium]